MAASPYDEMILNNPQDGEAYYGRALYFMEQDAHHYEEAKADLLKAIELEYELADCYSNLALLYDMQEDPTQAQSYLEKAISEDDEHVLSWFALGTLHSIYGRTTEALNALGRVITIESEQSEASEDEDGESDLTFAIEAFALRARIYLEEDKNELALAECLASRSFAGEENECEILEALALLRLGKESAARELLEEALAIELIDREELAEHALFAPLLTLLPKED